MYGSLRRKTCEEHRFTVRDKVEKATWKGLSVNDYWQQMKGLMMETAQDICGMTKGQCRHKETCWWNEEVAEAVTEKKIKYGKWLKMSHSGCALVLHFQPRVHHISISTHYHASSV